MSNEIEYRELPAGSIIKINGIPLELKSPAELGTHPDSWAHVEEKLLSDKEESRMADA